MLKQAFKKLLPPLACEAILASRDVAQTFSARSALSRNAVHLNSAFGTDVVIIANGPSLNKTDLSLLRPGTPCISCNYFRLHPLCNQLNIVAHCVGEPVKNNDPSGILDCLSGINPRSIWVHLSAKAYVPSNLADKCFYYCPSHSAIAPKLFRYSLESSALSYQSTAQMSIAVALYMGYKNIYLVGFDHDWLATRGYSPHFYDSEEGPSRECTPADLSEFSYTQMIEISSRLFGYYRLIKEASLEAGANIYNATPGSFLDLFKFKSFPQCVS